MSQKTIVNIGERVKMVHMYLAGSISMNGLEQIMEVNCCTVATRIRNYEAEGTDAFLFNKTHFIFSPSP